MAVRGKGEKELIKGMLNNNGSLNEIEKREAEKLWNSYSEARKEFEKEFNVYTGQSVDFQSQLDILLKARDMNRNSLALEIDIPPATLSRYKQGHFCPSLNVVMMICMALDLDLGQAMLLLGSLGRTLLSSCKEHYMYIYLLTNHKGMEIDKCNKLLKEFGIEEKYWLVPRNGRGRNSKKRK